MLGQRVEAGIETLASHRDKQPAELFEAGRRILRGPHLPLRVANPFIQRTVTGMWSQGDGQRVLDGGMEAWSREGLPARSIEQVRAVDAIRPGARVLDVRRQPEWDTFHFESAVHVPLHRLAQHAGELDRTQPWVVVCASGYRSNMAASVSSRSFGAANSCTA